tara:strand:+ start:369 stop:605 length:237 start_codon:yes stop_codon:yes gene_type:complete
MITTGISLYGVELGVTVLLGVTDGLGVILGDILGDGDGLTNLCHTFFILQAAHAALPILTDDLYTTPIHIFIVEYGNR